mmetsp:Transcript_32029/g.48298  ORF Transcript_32029/g.48298 Transcript_32029/m.48298 type:complete len:100 (-) Transcript_32029:59-358(-)
MHKAPFISTSRVSFFSKESAEASVRRDQTSLKAANSTFFACCSASSGSVCARQLPPRLVDAPATALSSTPLPPCIALFAADFVAAQSVSSVFFKHCLAN